MPNEVGVNVSKKITSAKERARLKSVVNLLKPVGVGVIVRTEAEGQTEAEIQEPNIAELIEARNESAINSLIADKFVASFGRGLSLLLTFS